MRWIRLLPPLAVAAMISTFAFATTDAELGLLRPYLDDFQELCEDAVRSAQCDAIDDMADFRAEGESPAEACGDLDELLMTCEDRLDEHQVACRIIEALADDFCEGVVPGEPACGRVAIDDALVVDERVTSCDGRFVLVLRGDGDLVLLHGEVVLWSSGTSGRPVAAAVMQGDGNLVIYGPGGEVLWTSGTGGHPGATLVVQDDGDVVIRGPDGAVLWSTHTCCR